MTVTLEIETVNENYVVISSLLKRREWAEQHNQQSEIENIDGLLRQLKGTSAYLALVDSELDEQLTKVSE